LARVIVLFAAGVIASVAFASLLVVAKDRRAIFLVSCPAFAVELAVFLVPTNLHWRDRDLFDLRVLITVVLSTLICFAARPLFNPRPRRSFTLVAALGAVALPPTLLALWLIAACSGGGCGN
jgi:hypothetical protein